MADSRTALTRRRSSWLCFSGCSTAFSSRFLHQSIRNTSSSPRVPKSTIQPGELSTTPHTSISLPPSPLVINKSGLSGCASGTHYPFPCGVTSHSRLKGCNLIPIFALFPRVCSFHAFPFESSLVTIRCFLRQNSTLPIVWLLTSSETKGIQECFGKNFSAQIARRSR